MKKLLATVSLLLSLALSAQVLKTSDWDKKARPVKNDPEAMSITGKIVIYSIATPYLPVDPTKKYKLSGKFRMASPLPPKPGKLKFGIQTYDQDKRPIQSEHTTILPRTNTTLVSAAEYGQRTVVIANAKQWKIIPNFSYIAFNVSDDFSDLPNRTTMALVGIKNLPDGQAELEFKEPLRDFYAAGTKVRLHHRLAAFLYGGALNQPLTENWQEFSGVFTGEQHGMSNNIFRKGTAFIQVVVMLEGAGTIEFKDIKFEEIP